MNEWIPVTERMPDTSDDVLTTYTINGEQKRYVKVANWYADDEGGGEWHSIIDEYRVCGAKREEVIAWMPLPKPYKG